MSDTIRAIKVRPNGYGASRRGRREPNRFHLPYHNRNPKWVAKLGKQPANRRTLMDIFSVLHGYASHSVTPVMKKWRAAERKFLQRHAPWLPFSRHSARFHNNFMSGRWL